jgi:uncharacterized membrane protein YgaE (UPF0421/DUF939 family)
MQFFLDLSRQAVSNLREGFQTALKLGIAVGLSYFTGTMVNAYVDAPTTITGGLWSATSTVFVMQTYAGGTLLASWRRFLGTFLGSAFAGIFISWLGTDSLALGASVFCITLFCFMTGLKDCFRLASLTAVIVMILWIINPDTAPWKFSLFRFIDSIVGISVGLIVASFFWSAQAKHKIKDNMLSVLKKIYQVIQLSPVVTNKDDPQIHQLIEDIDIEILETLPLIEEAKLEFIGHSAVHANRQMLFDHLIQMIDALKGILRCTPHPTIINHYHGMIDAFKALEQRILYPNIDIAVPSTTKCVQEIQKVLKERYSSESKAPLNLEEMSELFVYYYNFKILEEELMLSLKNE